SSAQSSQTPDATLTVKVDGLILLEASPNYALRGETDEHADNHWIDSVAKDSLNQAAEAFLNARWNTNSEKMLINDISLKGGGGFDIFGGWVRDIDSQCKSFGHCSHRLGLDVDIENLNRLRQLINIFESRGWTFIDEGQLTRGSTRYPHFRFE
ncbi:MAG TPA: hypothetical protein VGB10_04710, partial [Bacteroidota bacterium]